jgi:hypothetical protein
LHCGNAASFLRLVQCFREPPVVCFGGWRFRPTWIDVIKGDSGGLAYLRAAVDEELDEPGDGPGVLLPSQQADDGLHEGVFFPFVEDVEKQRDHARVATLAKSFDTRLPH